MAALSIDAWVAAVACCGWRHCCDACWGMAAVERSQLPEACVVFSFCGSKIGAAMLCSKRDPLVICVCNAKARRARLPILSYKEEPGPRLAFCKALGKQPNLGAKTATSQCGAQCSFLISCRTHRLCCQSSAHKSLASSRATAAFGHYSSIWPLPPLPTHSSARTHFQRAYDP